MSGQARGLAGFGLTDCDCDHAWHGHDVPQRAVWCFDGAQYLGAIGRAHCARYITHADIGIVGKPGQQGFKRFGGQWCGQ